MTSACLFLQGSHRLVHGRKRKLTLRTQVGPLAIETDSGKAASWVEPRRHQLRHGKEKKMLAEITQLKGRKGKAGKIIAEEKGYFERQAGRMKDASAVRRGWPIGSRAVESVCRQKQCRFKRPGQFWTSFGFGILCALDEARRNHQRNELWDGN